MDIVEIERFKQFKPNSVKREIPIMTENIMAVLLNIDSNSCTLGLNQPHSDKIYYVIEGSGVVTVGDESRDIKAGDLVLVPNGHHHKYTTTGEKLVLLTVKAVDNKLPKMKECREINDEEWDKHE